MNHLKINQKLMVLIAAAVLFLVTISGTSYYFLNEVTQRSNEMYENKLIAVQNIGLMRTNNRAISSFTLELMVTTDSTANEELREQTKERIDENNKLLKEYLDSSQDEPEELEMVRPYLEHFKTFTEETVNAQILAAQNKNEEAYKHYLANVEPVRKEMTDLGTKLNDYNRDTAAALNKKNQKSASQANALIIFTSVLSIILFIGLGRLISRMIVHPIRSIQLLMGQAEKGDLTAAGTYTSRDELGQLTRSFNDMTSGLRDVIRQVAETAEQVAASSEELNANSEETTRATELIAHTMEEMAGGSDHQLRQVSDTTTTINELADGVQQIAHNAQSVSRAAAGAIERAESGNQSIRQAVNKMGSINVTFEGLSGVIQGLGHRSNEIGQITDSITAIAAQTNLLALNAAIEAARAGEQGRGFAVVADEVRKLAEESAGAAQKITDLISAIQLETATAVEAMESAGAEVKDGIEVVHQAGTSFADITSAIGDVTGQIQEVSAAVQQMAAGTDQIVASIGQIQTISESAASRTENVSAASEEQMAAMEEIAASARSLAEMATQLQGMTRRFTV